MKNVVDPKIDKNNDFMNPNKHRCYILILKYDKLLGFKLASQ